MNGEEIKSKKYIRIYWEVMVVSLMVDGDNNVGVIIREDRFREEFCLVWSVLYLKCLSRGVLNI